MAETACSAHLTGRSCGPSTARVPPQKWGTGAPFPPTSADPHASFMMLWALSPRTASQQFRPSLNFPAAFSALKEAMPFSLSFMEKFLEVVAHGLSVSQCAVHLPRCSDYAEGSRAWSSSVASPAAAVARLPGGCQPVPVCIPCPARPGWGQAVCSGRCPSPQSSGSLQQKVIHSSALTQLPPWPLWFAIFRNFFFFLFFF